MTPELWMTAAPTRETLLQRENEWRVFRTADYPLHMHGWHLYLRRRTMPATNTEKATKNGVRTLLKLKWATLTDAVELCFSGASVELVVSLPAVRFPVVGLVAVNTPSEPVIGVAEAGEFVDVCPVATATSNKARNTGKPGRSMVKADPQDVCRSRNGSPYFFRVVSISQTEWRRGSLECIVPAASWTLSHSVRVEAEKHPMIDGLWLLFLGLLCG